MKDQVIDVGFVLRTKDYREVDQLITVYFKQYGKMTLVARGVKKIKSKNAIASLVNQEIEFTFIPRVGLSSLIKANPSKRFSHIEEDLDSQIYTAYFQEFLYRHEEENRPNEAHYLFLESIHQKLNQGYSPNVLYAFINSYILKAVGSAIQVDKCSVCGKTNHIVAISLSQGGFVCSSCVISIDYHYDKEFLKFFRRVNKADFSHLDIIGIPFVLLNEINKLLETFIDEYTGIHFQSRKFME